MDDAKRMAFRQRYIAAAHAMQAGVAMMMVQDPQPTTPKHLRVGVNSAMSDLSAIAKLMIAKGVITEEEYLSALCEQMESERDGYVLLLEQRLGIKVALV